MRAWSLLGPAILLIAAVAPAGAQDTCPAAAGSPVQVGWEAYRAGEIEAAGAAFRSALERCPGHPGAETGLGYVALRREDEALARRMFESVLEKRPESVDALNGLGLVAWRAGDLGAAEARFREVTAIEPDDPTAADFLVRIARARTARAGASPGIADRAAAVDPASEVAGRGRASPLESPETHRRERVALEAILERDPDRLEALRGLARILTWTGELVAGETLSRRALALDSTDLAVLVGLAQNLRWQGRNAAACEVLERAERLSPGHPGVAEQRDWVRVSLGPQVRPRLVVEDDSDGNRMVSALLVGRWHPAPRLGLRMDAYARSMKEELSGGVPALDLTARGFVLSASGHVEPGWTLVVGAGRSASDRDDGPGPDGSSAWLASVSTPSRAPVSATLAWSRLPWDYTARMTRAGLVAEALSGTVRWSPAVEWQWEAEGSAGTWTGAEENDRWSGRVTVLRTVGTTWRFGLEARAFGFDRDVQDGYFDPDVYALMEARVRWLREPGAWSVFVEAAPGLQRIGSEGDVSTSVRAETRITYRLHPGREIFLDGMGSTAGVQSFSGGEDYRYTAVTVGGVWVF